MSVTNSSRIRIVVGITLVALTCSGVIVVRVVFETTESEVFDVADSTGVPGFDVVDIAVVSGFIAAFPRAHQFRCQQRQSLVEAC